MSRIGLSAALLAAFAVVAAGCTGGGDSSSGRSPTATIGGPETAVTGSPDTSTAPVETSTAKPPGADQESAPPAPNGADQPDPCRLVTQSEVGEALGSRVGAGTPRPGGLAGQRTCLFAASGSSLMVTVSILPGGKPTFERLQAGAGDTAEEVRGVGDAAFRSAGFFGARKGDHVILVFVNGLDDPRAVDKATTEIAKAAIGRL